jgi:hypothetical protein
VSFLSKITGRDRARNQLQNSLSKVQGAAAAQPLSPQNLAGQYGQALTTAKDGGFKEDPNGWQQAFNQTAGATINNALPQLRNDLQMTRENAIRRGISTGDLGTSFEGDVTSAWGRNLSNALAGQALGAYTGYENRAQSGYENSQNRYLDLLTGAMDRNTAEENANKKKKSGLYGTLGTIGGYLIGGPTGGIIGGQLGSQIGGY